MDDSHLCIKRMQFDHLRIGYKFGVTLNPGEWDSNFFISVCQHIKDTYNKSRQTKGF